MKLELEREAKSILARYNSWREAEFYNDPLNYTKNPPKQISLENFERDINWYWVSYNYHMSHAFIWEYHKQLDMKYLFKNFVITEVDFLKIKEQEIIADRFEILDL